MGDLPDVNFWIALGAEAHEFRQAALDYWRESTRASAYFCRVTALGLIRVSCQVHPPNTAPLTPPEAWEKYSRLRSGGRVGLLGEPPGVDRQLGEWVRAGLVSRRTWTDAYLAAFAMAGSLRLVTFDRDFLRFPGLDLLCVEPPAL